MQEFIEKFKDYTGPTPRQENIPHFGRVFNIISMHIFTLPFFSKSNLYIYPPEKIIEN